MNEDLREAYLSWLEPQVRSDLSTPAASTYRDLLRIMLETEFVWLVSNDDNRIVDGLDLRPEFINVVNWPSMLSPKHLGPCSVLEVLVGLSRRMAFMGGGSAEAWAWQLITNLGLHRMRDHLTRSKSRKVVDILDRLIWRTYAPDGQGGFFPLAWPEKDQAKVELWYQMSAYINEIHPEY